MPCVADVIAFLERFAPLELAEEWDNVGLLVGDNRREVRSVMTCLTLTPEVAREAIERQAGLIVTHHPVLFRAVKRLTAADSEGRMLLDLIAAGVAIYSPHTAYDSAEDGINEQLARLFGLTEIEPLRRMPAAGRCKIVCFVPRSHLAEVQRALWSAGAGVIGEYSKCSFVVDGAGSFEGSAAANPSVGQAERLESVDEARLEVVCPEQQIAKAVRCLKEAHPYEEPAIDVYPLKASQSRRGAGRTGVLAGKIAEAGAASRPMPLSDFLETVKVKFSISHLPYVGDLTRPISRVAIACGSGGEFLSAAIEKQCDVLVTGEARFHTCLAARGAGMGLVLAGHYATERPALEYLAGILAREFPDLAIRASQAERDPVQWN